MKKFAVTMLSLVVCVALCAQDYGTFDGKARDVSLVQLIVQPEKYIDTIVRVRGALHWEFESSYLFLSRDHLESYDTASATEVGLSQKGGSPTKEQLEECSNALVMLEGVFRMDSRRQSYWLEITRVLVRDGRRSKEKQKESNQPSQPTPANRRG